MIWHVKKQPTKKEIAEHEEWKRKHLEDAERKIQRLKAKTKPKQTFFQAQSSLINERLKDHRAIPSHVPPVEKVVKRDPLLDMDPEQREDYLRREKLAQEEIEAKKSRTGPMYNKGGDQYWTEEMLNDLKGGGHRRR